MPAIIGGAYAVSTGEFDAFKFALIIIGLICAEALNLFGYDFQYYKKRDDPEYLIKNPKLPGNPVLSERLFPFKRIPIVMAIAGIIGLTILIYFAAESGWRMVMLLLLAVGIGALYLKPPFPYAFLSTALLPPIISGGAYLAMSGVTDFYAFLAGLPVAWISVGVILNYRRLYYSVHTFSKGRLATVIIFYLIAIVNIFVLYYIGLYSKASLITVAIFISFFFLLSGVYKTEKEDSIPATSLGVALHALTSIVIAASLL